MSAHGGKPRGPVESPGPARATLGVGSPGRWGAMLGIAFGVGLVGLALVGALRAEPLPAPLLIGLGLVGAAEAALCWFAIQRRRAAWAFATAISATAALAFLFSAPKIRDAMHVDLLVALAPMIIAAVIATLLAIAAPEI